MCIRDSFKTIKAVRGASLEQLQEVVPKNTAQAVYQYFSQEREKTGER